LARLQLAHAPSQIAAQRVEVGLLGLRLQRIELGIT
jgi:hypothetical protein